MQVVLLTSARPSEGKTSVTLNLAITLAQSGRQVVVIDADLRAGNCHALLGLKQPLWIGPLAQRWPAPGRSAATDRCRRPLLYTPWTGSAQSHRSAGLGSG